MTKKEALALLDLDLNASSHEIESTYRKQYNEYQIRITNAPTASQRTKFQEKLAELDTAYGVLKGDSSENIQNELPSVTPVASASGNTIEASRKSSKQLSNEDAKNVLGLSANYSKRELENAYQVKKAACEESIRNAFNKEVENAYRDAHIEIESAYQTLTENTDSAENATNNYVHKTQNKGNSHLIMGVRKSTLLYFGAGAFVLILLGFIFLNGSQNMALKETGETLNAIEESVHQCESHRDMVQDCLSQAEEVYDEMNRTKRNTVQNDLDQMINLYQEAEQIMLQLYQYASEARAYKDQIIAELIDNDEGLAMMQLIQLQVEMEQENIEELLHRIESTLQHIEDVSASSWSAKDIQRFKNDYEENREDMESVLGNKTEDFVDCLLGKCMRSFDNYYAADGDKLDILGQECMEEVVGISFE